MESQPHVLEADTSTLVVGELGSGRTDVMLDRASRLPYDPQTPVLVYGDSEQFRPVFEATGYDVLTLGAEESDVTWTPLADLRSEEQIPALVSTIFGPPDNDPFHAPAKAVFTAIVRTLYRDGEAAASDEASLTGKLRSILTADCATIHDRLTQSPDCAQAAQQIDPARPMAEQVRQQLQTTVLPVLDQSATDQQTLAIQDYLAEPQGRVLLVAPPDPRILSSPRSGQVPLESPSSPRSGQVLLEWAITTALERETDVRVVLEKPAAIEPVSVLPDLLGTRRQASSTVILGTESVAQLQDCYLHDAPGIIHNCPQRVYASIRDEETRAQVESAITGHPVSAGPTPTPRPGTLPGPAGGQPPTLADLLPLSLDECLVTRGDQWYVASIQPAGSEQRAGTRHRDPRT